jgi:hypothetical protein
VRIRPSASSKRHLALMVAVFAALVCLFAGPAGAGETSPPSASANAGAITAPSVDAEHVAAAIPQTHLVRKPSRASLTTWLLLAGWVGALFATGRSRAWNRRSHASEPHAPPLVYGLLPPRRGPPLLVH